MTRRDAGMSLVEVLVAIVLVGAAFFPVIDLLRQSRRVAVMATRQLYASAEAQSMIEGMMSLEPGDLPPVGTGWTEILGDGPGGGAGGSPKWMQMAAYFRLREKKEIERHLEATASGDPDRVIVRARVKYKALPGEAEMERELVLVGLVVKKV